MGSAKQTIQLVNRKAFSEYEILERFEAGIALVGTEVKSLRQGRASFKDSYAKALNNELWLVNFHITPYDHGGYANHDPFRPRKLLLHRYEIKRLIGKIEEKGLTLVPLKVYFKNGRVKIELALARGKKIYDKRQDIAKRDMTREAQRELKNKYRIKI
ncbi:MAG: SsrA-binding protein SmpB [candidate division KSB1 bacterium]|nr:SsrA-binding protein SmpB [candidate division KSB1 bacterium]